MPAKKKSTRKRGSVSQKSFFKRPSTITGIVLCVLGLFFIIVDLSKGSSVGPVGKWLYDGVLFGVFGKAALLVSVYMITIGLGVLFSKRKLPCLSGQTCLMVAVLIFTNLMFTVDKNPDAPVVHGAYLGYLLGALIQKSIGTAGLILVALVILIAGTVLLVPRLILMEWLHMIVALIKSRKSRPAKQAKTQTSSKQTATIEPAQSSKTVPVKDTQSEATCDETPMASLNLALYDKAFVKIPNGLFEEHTVFDRDLPVGTRKQDLIDAFASFNVDIEIGDIKRGPSFEQYEIIPAKGVKVTQIRGREEDVSLKLKQKIHLGKMSGGSLVAEVPLQDRQTVPYGYLLEDTSDDNLAIPVAVGVDASFAPFSVDLAELPHLLIAGTTGSGKSVFVKTLIASIMYHLTPNEARLVLIDPKRVEFGVFAKSLFCACDIITDFEDVPPVFNALIQEMEHRYTLLEQAGVPDLKQYNAKVRPDKKQPYIIVVVDEFADLLMQNADGFEQPAIRLAQKARACGIHLVLATQRPSADVIKGLLKTNIPGRIALSVSSKIDSKIILDISGAENLTGKGDLICLCPAFRDGIRLQGAYISNDEIKKIMAAKA